MSKYDNELLLGLWLDGELTNAQRQEFEHRCLEDNAFAQQVELANSLSLQADSYIDQTVPQWNKKRTFKRPTEATRWRWLPVISLATSALAIIMVITGTQVRFEEGGMRVSFNEQHAEQELTRMVDTKLEQFKQTQQAALNLYAQTLQQQQLDTSSQLTSYLLSSSRKERREDFAELIKFVNEQRSDDQYFYARQLNKLQQNIYRDTDNVPADKINQ